MNTVPALSPPTVEPCTGCNETGELLQGRKVIHCRDCGGRGYRYAEDGGAA